MQTRLLSEMMELSRGITFGIKLLHLVCVEVWGFSWGLWVSELV